MEIKIWNTMILLTLKINKQLFYQLNRFIGEQQRIAIIDKQPMAKPQTRWENKAEDALL